MTSSFINRVFRLIKQIYSYNKKSRKDKAIEKEKAGTQKNSYALDDHLSQANLETRRLFEIIHNKIVALDEAIIIEPKARYIAYKLAKNFVGIIVLRSSLRIFLNVPSGELYDPYNIARDLNKPKKIRHGANGNYDVILQSEEQIDRVFRLIEQSYSHNKKSRESKAIEKEKPATERNSYVLNDHLSKAKLETRILFETIHDKIMALDKSITVEPKASYIIYNRLSKNIVGIVVQRSGLRIFLNVPSGELQDRYSIARDLTKPKKIKHWGRGDYDVILKREEQVKRVLGLIRQSYSYNKKLQREKAIKEDNRRTLAYHRSKASPEIRTLFDAIHDKIVALDEAIGVEPKAVMITYKLAKVFVDIAVQKSSLKIFLNMRSGKLYDPYNIARDLTKPKVAHFGKGDYQIVLQSEGQINQALELIKQSYSYNKKVQKEKAIKEDDRRTLAYHRSKASPETRALFDAIHNKIIALDEAITVEPKAVMITYKLAKVFVEITVQESSLKIFLNMRSGKLYDPYNSARDLTKPKVAHFGRGDYQITLQSEGQINRALEPAQKEKLYEVQREGQINQTFELIKQSYNHNK